MSVIKYKDPTTGEWKPVGGIFSDGSGSDSVPSYVREEAERVAKVVQSHQNANTITFLACSDVHLPVENHSDYGDIKNGLIHAGQAMGLLRKQIHADFAFYGGDMIWDVGETTETAMDTMRFVHEILSEGFNGVQFWAEGNHESGYESGSYLTAAQIFANVGAWNSGAVFNLSDRIGGYCYKDFEDYKVRVVCINTGSGYNDVSSKQNAWLIDALSVPVEDGWGTILLSHCSLDWNGGNASETTNIMNTIKAASGIICAIHGHTHCYKIDKITGTDIPRIAVPNICFTRNNGYGRNGSSFGETDTYNKTANTANDTSFAVITIDRQKGEAYVDYYGARPEDTRTVEGLPTWGKAAYTNLVPTAKTTPGGTEVYNGSGYMDGYYVSSGHTFGQDPNCVAVGFIPFVVGDEIYLYCPNADITTNSHVRLYTYYSDGGTHLLSNTLTSVDGDEFDWIATTGDIMATVTRLGDKYYKITPSDVYTGNHYFRVSLYGTGENLIITINEPIE